MSWGPWQLNLPPAERLARLRALRALAEIFAHRFADLVDTLAVAETGDETALRDALRLLERLPTVNRRRIYGSYSDLARGTLVKDARERCGAGRTRQLKGTRMTKHIRDADMHPFGHSIAHGRSALHPHLRHRVHPIAHDLDTLLGAATSTTCPTVGRRAFTSMAATCAIRDFSAGVSNKRPSNPVDRDPGRAPRSCRVVAFLLCHCGIGVGSPLLDRAHDTRVATAGQVEHRPSCADDYPAPEDRPGG